ncbi:MAG: hypothetical protein LBF76_00880 [Holosporales bacterium]|jgi:hypothetical protein|nr:hypothetical protein [Holosporales bacterium]
MLSRCSVEILLDLLEIKLAAFVVQDRDDPRELERLKNCKRELSDLSQNMSQYRKRSLLHGETAVPALLRSI